MRSQAAGVDLLCGPDSPLPEARQRYRLLYHLGAGGQAEVYRGVRLSAGVSSSPVTVKVFRPDPRRAVLEQLRSWDKGDAVLMDLNSRGVAGICLRVDGFYGLPPTVAGTAHISQQRIPYQVLDYLPGGTLIERLAGGASALGPARLYGMSVLATLADTLYALHFPSEVGDSPVLHMDVKPSNVIVLPDGEVRLIDFTTARYDHAAHITTIPHTPESAGPEAYTGHVGAAYDVHGFGSVAYYLVTGWLPRADRSNMSPAHEGVPGGLRRHPLLDEYPALAAHLLAPLADRPEDRPRTDELPGWIDQLAHLAAALPAHVRFVDWSEDPDAPRPAPTQRVASMPAAATDPVSGPSAATAHVPGPAAGATQVAAAQPVVPRQSGASSAPPTRAAPTEVASAPASAPVGRLKQGIRSKWAAWWAEPGAAAAGVGGGAGVAGGGVASASAGLGGAGSSGSATAGAGGASASRPGGSAGTGSAGKPGAPDGRAGAATPRPTRISASAPVPVRQPVKKPSRFDDRPSASAPPPAAGRGADPRHDPSAQAPRWRSGWKLTKFGAIVASVCWAVWVATTLFARRDLIEPLTGAAIAAGGAVVVYWLTRLAGHLLRTTLDRGPRRGTVVPHLAVMLFLVFFGMQFLSRTPLAPDRVLAFFQGLG